MELHPIDSHCVLEFELARNSAPSPSTHSKPKPGQTLAGLAPSPGAAVSTPSKCSFDLRTFMLKQTPAAQRYISLGYAILLLHEASLWDTKGMTGTVGKSFERQRKARCLPGSSNVVPC